MARDARFGYSRSTCHDDQRICMRVGDSTWHPSTKSKRTISNGILWCQLVRTKLAHSWRILLLTAILQIKVTNHSGRKTVVRKLKAAMIPESSIIKITGHTTVAGLRSYDPADEKEFRGMSDVLSGHLTNNHQPNPHPNNMSFQSIMNSGSTFNSCVFNFGVAPVEQSPPRKSAV